jgi:hypothetical protein
VEAPTVSEDRLTTKKWLEKAGVGRLFMVRRLQLFKLEH